MSKTATITQMNEEVTIQFGTYPANPNLVFMQTHDEIGCPFSRLTTCIVNESLPDIKDGNCILDTNNNGEEILEELTSKGIVTLTGQKVSSGFSEYYVAKVNPEYLNQAA